MIVLAQIVTVVGRYQRNTEFLLHAEHIRVDLLFELQPLILNFEKEIPLAEDALIPPAPTRPASYLPAIRFSQNSPARHPEKPISPAECSARYRFEILGLR